MFDPLKKKLYIYIYIYITCFAVIFCRLPKSQLPISQASDARPIFVEVSGAKYLSMFLAEKKLGMP